MSNGRAVKYRRRNRLVFRCARVVVAIYSNIEDARGLCFSKLSSVIYIFMRGVRIDAEREIKWWRFKCGCWAVFLVFIVYFVVRRDVGCKFGRIDDRL